MAKYVLECPACESRFELKQYAPDTRVRCRKCGAVVIIPFAPGDRPAVAAASPGLDPEVRRKLVQALSLRKLALVSGLLCVALVGASYILMKRGEARAQETVKKPDDTVSLAKMEELNRLLAYPLKSGYSWEYAVTGGGLERRTVGGASEGVSGGPEFTVGIAGSSAAGTQSLRVVADGVYLVSEMRGISRSTYEPPVRILTHPLYMEQRWTYQGQCVREGKPAEKWSLEFYSRNVENVPTRAGDHPAFRIEVKGKKGDQEVDEILWYRMGVGLVKRQTKLVDGTEEAVLTRYTRN